MNLVVVIAGLYCGSLYMFGTSAYEQYLVSVPGEVNRALLASCSNA
jgi:hypothetical protein